MDLVIGVDGGGSTTRLALARADGAVVARGRAGPSNPHDVGWEGLRAALAVAREEAFASLGRRLEPARAAAVGLAGVSSEEERARVLVLLAELELAPQPALLVESDMEIAWRGAFACEPGIVLVAGTGSVAYGRDARGRSARAGGWGALIDDAGSATWIAREALAAAARAEDGRGPLTTLGRELCAALGCADFRALRASIASGGRSRDQLALLAREVQLAWRSGDAVAGKILERAGEELALCVSAVARALLPDRLPIACTGGLFLEESPVREALDRTLARDLPRHERRDPCFSPLGGAVLAALAHAGIPLGAGIRAQLATDEGTLAPRVRAP
jgi:N-acetylglucosamine kinase-like BadF-type ATPase